MSSKHTLFYSSLEAKLKKYKEDGKYQEENELYQILQNKVIKNSDREATLTAIKIARLRQLERALKGGVYQKNKEIQTDNAVNTNSSTQTQTQAQNNMVSSSTQSDTISSIVGEDINNLSPFYSRFY